jgi:thiamine pyrophosphokinase
LRAVIIAGGALPHADIDRGRIRPDDLILAADGGGRHCLALGLRPAAVIGDFDSLEPPDVLAFEASGADLVRHPPRKEQTDLELAVRYALERGATEIVILAGLGTRWDQSIANLLLAGAPGLEGIRLEIVDGPQEIYPLHAGDSLELRGRPGDVSIPLQRRGGDLRARYLSRRHPALRLDAGHRQLLTAPMARITLNGLLLCDSLCERTLKEAGCRDLITLIPVRIRACSRPPAPGAGGDDPRPLPSETVCGLEAENDVTLRFLASGDAGEAVNKAVCSQATSRRRVLRLDSTFLCASSGDLEAWVHALGRSDRSSSIQTLMPARRLR